jgi:peptidoglycan hydrolase-like protein with peptidoglycan-binding domain
MRTILFALGLLVALAHAPAAQAQDQVWVQIEALPTLREAEDRARAYASAFPNVSGFQLRSGWYAILIGPYGVEAAAGRLVELSRENLVPADSFIADGTDFRQQFWPVGVQRAIIAPDVTATVDPNIEPTIETPDVAVVEPTLVPEPIIIPEETTAEARRSEAELPREDREALQTALQWFGYYSATIDGDFGPGTRNSMVAWQTDNGVEPTGVLTTTQRGTLLAAYRQAQAELGLKTVVEPEAGIEITLPMALVKFDHYEPPFVHFAEKDGSGVQVYLISQPGDQSSLYGLYDILQTLEVVPFEGERTRGERSFTISGKSANIESYSYAEISGGLIKGYMLVWNPADGERMARVLAAMQVSFKSSGDTALDPGLAPMAADARAGLLSGLEVRRPKFSRSGFFIDTSGTVLTTVEAVTNCGRVTLEHDKDANVVFADEATGLAMVKPRVALSPTAIAEFQTAPERVGSEVAVSGYSYEDTLPAPVLTFGALEALQGLNGETGVKRLSLDTRPGDAGGPVLDGTGSVLGMLLPRVVDAKKVLPAEVAFAASAQSIATRLATEGITTAPSLRSGAMAPEDLSTLATGMTVLVSCWE